jgi:hypothetical protein
MPSLRALAAQTTYAEIVDLCTMADIDATFPPNGGFVATIVKGRRHGYDQSGAHDASSHQCKNMQGRITNAGLDSWRATAPPNRPVGGADLSSQR